MIQVELTPNPNSLKFVSDRKLSEMSGEEFKKNNLQKIKNNTIKDLLEIEGVEQIYISDNFLTVNKKADSNWEVLKPMVIANINHHLEKDKGPIIKSTKVVNASKTEEDTKIVSDIKEVLNTKIKPAVARDGGDIQFLSQQLDLTNIYNRQMQELINSQNLEIQSINEQMVELDNTNRGILPKLEEMVLTLESIVQNDIPFLLNERNSRIETLKDILLQSNVSTSEKFRRVFEAYQIENEYGRTVESYRDEIFVDGNAYNVEIFRLGRVGLYARTSDGNFNAMYSKKEKTWIKQKGIDSELVIALKIARKELPPSLLKLPVEKF